MSKEHLDVRFFKRLITFTVLALIIGLIVFLAISRGQVKTLQKDISKLEATQVESSDLESLDYQKKYPSMYVKSSNQLTEAENTVYLTFDDGPSVGVTDQILDMLKEQDVKATFFIVPKKNDEAKALVQRMIDEGHTVGIHTASHKYNKIYRSVGAYLNDFYKVQSYLKKEFNYEAKIFRFPGGSVNSYNLGIYDRIIPEMYRRGYTFYDWNVSSGDAAVLPISEEEIVNNVVVQSKRNSRSIVLLHDSKDKSTTANALPEIITRLKKAGYEFAPLDNSVRPILFTAG